MKQKILITGPPRSGKSTLVSKFIEYYTEETNFTIYGFLTPEVRENGKRIGFDIVDIYTGNVYRLARVGGFRTKYKLGKYNVFIEEFDNYIKENFNFEGKDVNLFVIDEIGKMELFSELFHNFVKEVFSLEIPIIATIGLKLKHPIKNYLQHLPSVQLLFLNRTNFKMTFEKIISLLD